MNNLLHKKIIFKKRDTISKNTEFNIYGTLIGWTDGHSIIDNRDILTFMKDNWSNGGFNSFNALMREIVGPCIIEVMSGNEKWFFASPSSSGFYWLKDSKEENIEYLVSNDEGNFFRAALKKGFNLIDGSLMNAIMSHQSLIRPPFDGLFENTKRCPPGFSVKFSMDKSELECFLINSENKTRIQQDFILNKKIDAIARLYELYCKNNNSISKLSFSGGIDSTVLLLSHKSGLDKNNHGFYINRGKVSETNMAQEISKVADCKIDFIKPDENLSYTDVRNRAKTGLSIMNGIVYMKHGFKNNPYKISDNKKILILTGQNSDTLFHIDTHAPSSFTVGFLRILKLATSMHLRFKTTIIYYKIYRLFNKYGPKNIFPPGVVKTFTSLSEHKNKNNNLPIQILNVINDYKKNFYVLPLENWLKGEFNKKLSYSKLSYSERDNHAARLARWLRTVGNFHQQFLNLGNYEKTVICTPYSEGPLASELLTYKLGLVDIFKPKFFLHRYISLKLNKTYSNIRKKVLKISFLSFSLQVIIYLLRFMKKKNSKNNNFVNIEEINKLRKIILHKDGTVERLLLKFIKDPMCKSYINQLYDYLDLKIDCNKLDSSKGMQLCRLVNLHLMLEIKYDN